MSRGTSRRELLFGRLRRALTGPDPAARRVQGVSRDIALYDPERRVDTPQPEHAPEESPPPWLINHPSQS